MACEEGSVLYRAKFLCIDSFPVTIGGQTWGNLCFFWFSSLCVWQFLSQCVAEEKIPLALSLSPNPIPSSALECWEGRSLCGWGGDPHRLTKITWKPQWKGPQWEGPQIEKNHTSHSVLAEKQIIRCPLTKARKKPIKNLVSFWALLWVKGQLAFK